MSEPVPTFEPRLQELQKELEELNSPQQTIEKLIQIRDLLSSLQLEQIYSIKDLLIKHLNPISKVVTNFNLPKMLKAKQNLQSVLSVIVEWYAKAIRFRYQVLAFQLLGQLLDRTCTLLVRRNQCQSNQQYDLQKHELEEFNFEWIAIKGNGFSSHSFFYFKCEELVLRILDGIQTNFKIGGLNFIRQLINFLIKISGDLKNSRLSSIVDRYVESLEEMMANPSVSKDQVKELSPEMIKGVSEAGSKLCSICSKHDTKRRFDLLCAIYGLGMLKSSSKQRKINGLKLINTVSETFYRGGHSFIKEQEYVNWLYSNGVVDLILEQSSQSPILKSCNHIFRIIFKRRCLGIENFEKILHYIQQTTHQNRLIVLRNLDLESIRLQYADYEVLVKFLRIPQKPQFYEEDLFSVCSQCIRYSTNNILKQFIYAIGDILKNNYNKFRSNYIQLTCLRCYIKAIIRFFDKDGESESKKKQLIDIYDSYFQSQFTPLGVQVFKQLFEDLPTVSDLSKTKTACFLINHKNIIRAGLASMNKSNDKLFNQEIQQLLCTLLKYANDFYSTEKVTFNSTIFVEAINSPKMFEKLTTFVGYNGQELAETFQSLLNKFNVQRISFDCIKSIFFRINFLYVREIKQYNQEYRFEILSKVTALKGVENLTYLLLNASNSENRSTVANFLTDLHTSIPESRIPDGEVELQNFMKETLQMTLNQYKSKQSELRLLGYLALIESLMMGTEVIGVGKYRPHNSLVPISTVQINIMNDISYGNDVSQSYWKKVSSNLTLFDLLTELSQKFRCSACQISLQEGDKFWPEKWNGLTLEQLKIDDKLLKAVKTSKQKIRKEKLIQSGELTPKAKKVFEQIYKTFAVDGKMGTKQCANFVAGVTKTSSSIYDGRVIQFFKQYDLDQDGNLDLEDFFRFYKNHCTPDKDDIVWKNLNNMRFRKDLNKYDDPIELTNENILFRSILYKCQQFYELLFSYSQSTNKQLQERCKRLLLRLPTFPKTLQSLKSDLDLISKNCFQTEYLLIAIRSKLNPTDQNKVAEQNKRQFIQSGNLIKIFEMMLRIDKLPNASQDQKKCLYISLQIIRSLLQVPDLRTNISFDGQTNINLNLPETNLFLKLAQNSLKSMDIDILEASLALQMTQNQLEIQFPLEGIFHDELGIRKICSNYLFVLYILQKIDIDLFAIEQKPNCQFWFEILTKVCTLNRGINFDNVIKRSLSIIKTRQQSIQKNPDDPIIFGNLSIICTILQQRDKTYADISSEIVEISQNVISVRSRKLIYTILMNFDVLFTVQFLSGLIDSVEVVKEVEPKKCFVGLKNLGSTCYMNSVIQVLFCVPEFKDFILSLPKPEIEISKVNGKDIYDNTLFQLQKMYTYLIHSQKKYYNPEEFCLTIKKGNTEEPIDPRLQEDAHEFVGKFLDKLEKQAQRTGRIENFRQILEGSTVTQVLCKKCSNKINREQKFSQLSLAVQDIKSLEQSFQKYIIPEQIEDYFCSSCNCKVDKIQKSTYLNKLPKLLTINLQRIVYDLQNLVNKKIDTNFSFPENLNVYNYLVDESNLTSEDCQFKLKAIIVHSGTSESGHYYSIIHINNQWYKFNDQTVNRIQFKDIAHQCFGGSQSKQQWTQDLKFSTNAYMLFYENKNNKPMDIQYNEDHKLIREIDIDNQKFYKQLQTHQESIFIFANELYEKFLPKDLEEKIKCFFFEQNWQEDPNTYFYDIIYEFSVKLLKFATVFYDVKPQYLFKVGDGIFRLFYLLPEKSYSFITSLDPDQYIDNLCLHNDQTIRNIHKCLLNKSMHIFINYYQTNFQSSQQGMVKLITIIDHLFAFLEDERLVKNIAKSFNYFQFWKTSCQYFPDIVNYLVEKEALVIFGDLILGANSPFKDEKAKKKAVEVPSPCAFLIIHILLCLSSRKKNLKNYINPIRVFPNLQYYELTEKQRILLGDVSFYSKMLSFKFDTGQVGIIAAKICECDYQFSKKLVPIFLKALNNIINPDTAFVILTYIRSYLAIDDEFMENRLKWILGIPQLRMGDELVYGLAYEDQSLAYQYTSPLHFVKADKQDYKTALAILYENHSTFNSFSIEGVIVLLNLMCNIPKIYDYIMKLPAPTYLHRCYLDWIEKFISNFKESYVMQDKIADKALKITSMVTMFNYLVQRTKQLSLDLPVNKLIIGRNRDLFAIQSTYTQDYKMTLWAHLTYILPNIPNNNINESLPKDIFKFGNPTGFAKYFISIGKAEMVQQNIQINSELTTYTLEIEAKQPATLKFKLPTFGEQIVIQKGKIFINFPYRYEEQQLINGKISNLIDIIPITKVQQMINQQKMQKEDMEATEKQMLEFYATQSEDGKACKACTFINKPGDSMCQICYQTL